MKEDQALFENLFKMDKIQEKQIMIVTKMIQGILETFSEILIEKGVLTESEMVERIEKMNNEVNNA